MRKHVYLAALAAVALMSCQQEKSIEGGAGSNEVAFSLQSAATRSAEIASPVETGVSISLGKMEGRELFLEETIVNLNDFVPETKGAPVYTENVGYLYKDQLGVHTDAAGGVDASYARLSDGPSDGGWAYQHKYDVNIWSDENTDVQFYLYMPADMKTNGVSSMAYDAGVATIKYTSPATAAAQEDIIFGGIKMNHKKYKGKFYPQGAPVKMYHALTGIKFAIKNTTAELENIQIHKISFNGLKNKGTLTFTSPSTIAWDDLEVSTTETTVGEGAEATTVQVPNVIYQTFEDGDLVTYDATTHAGNNFADSFFAAGANQNLNKADASYTFWLIPQGTVDSDASLKIEYTMNGKDEEMEIPFDLLKASNWQAGQLRTYTFKLDEVNVKITDTVNIPASATPENGFSGAKKTGVTITNTGNTKAYIRAAIVGQWLDKNNNPVFGFTDEINTLYVVQSWYEDQFVNGEYSHGQFIGLPGYGAGKSFYTPNPDHDWQLCDDDYYYYTKVVNPGDATGTALFTSYETKIAPAAAIAGEEMDTEQMHFELEIATQAISAVKIDGTEYSWTEAWYRALGKTPVIKPAN